MKNEIKRIVKMIRKNWIPCLTLLLGGSLIFLAFWEIAMRIYTPNGLFLTVPFFGGSGIIAFVAWCSDKKSK